MNNTFKELPNHNIINATPFSLNSYASLFYKLDNAYV